jgi:hypothetical protein
MVVFALAVAGCGSSSDSDEGAADDTKRTTTTSVAPDSKGQPISEPVCDFLGVSADDAGGILGTAVTATSTVGSSNPAGGACRYVPPAGDDAAVSIAVYPDTEARFAAYIDDFTQETGPSGRRLWTDPVEVPGVGTVAYTFKSPDGGYDNVWVFTNGYRVLASDRNTVDVPGAHEKLEALARAAVDNL